MTTCSLVSSSSPETWWGPDMWLAPMVNTSVIKTSHSHQLLWSPEPPSPVCCSCLPANWHLLGQWAPVLCSVVFWFRFPLCLWTSWLLPLSPSKSMQFKPKQIKPSPLCSQDDKPQWGVSRLTERVQSMPCLPKLHLPSQTIKQTERKHRREVWYQQNEWTSTFLLAMTLKQRKHTKEETGRRGEDQTNIRRVEDW